jgi:hypothetical protein
LNGEKLLKKADLEGLDFLVINYPFGFSFLLKVKQNMLNRGDYIKVRLVNQVLDFGTDIHEPFYFVGWYNSKVATLANSSKGDFYLSPAKCVSRQIESCGINKNLIREIKGFPTPAVYSEMKHGGSDVPHKNAALDEQGKACATIPIMKEGSALVCFGAQGSPDMIKILRILIRKAGASTSGPSTRNFVFVCGRNEELKKRLLKMHHDAGAPTYIKIVGFINLFEEIPRHEFYVGKPGASTAMECLILGVPFLTTLTLDTYSQEKYTCHFLKEEKVGIPFKRYSDLIDWLYSHASKTEGDLMRKRAKEIGPSYGQFNDEFLSLLLKEKGAEFSAS